MGRAALADHEWDARRSRQRGIQLTAQGLQSNSLGKGVVLLGMNGLKAAPSPSSSSPLGFKVPNELSVGGPGFINYKVGYEMPEHWWAEAGPGQLLRLLPPSPPSWE